MSPSSSDLVAGQEALAPEIARRRTFAIISHPDAGKTTLTEKLLLYAGAIELAGAVRGSKTQRHAVSDWMEMEQQRGISISAAALEFELDGRHVTLLDTPGHQDFSEDTYRTLLAVDCADSAAVAELVGEKRQQELIEAIDIITGAGTRFDRDAYRHATQTPVFFGSALNDFGVEPFLHALLTLAPSPGPRDSDVGPIEPTDANFSGFIFKIQANMNPRHRDRVAFLRICSGRLAKDMSVVNARLDTP